MKPKNSLHDAFVREYDDVLHDTAVRTFQLQVYAIT